VVQKCGLLLQFPKNSSNQTIAQWAKFAQSGHPAGQQLRRIQQQSVSRLSIGFNSISLAGTKTSFNRKKKSSEIFWAQQFFL
jgi:hypothetical protein